MKRARKIFFILSICIYFFGCSKKAEEPAKVEDSVIDTSVDENYETKVVAVEDEHYADLQRKPLSKINWDLPNFKKQAVATAHAKYLKDELKFSEFNYSQDDADGLFVVVGSDVCKFFEKTTLKTLDDIGNLTGGVPVPFGTICRAYSFVGLTEYGGSEIASKAIVDFQTFRQEKLAPVEFEDENNWFYEVEFNGQRGLIFGADIYAVDRYDSLWNEFEANYISTLYKNNAHYEEFMPYVNWQTRLSDSVMGELEKEKLAFETVSHEINYLDDFIGLYSANSGSDWTGEASRASGGEISNFITTDLIAHVKHVIFDESLQRAEENFFVPKLYDLIDLFLKKLDDVNTPASSITASEETLTKAKEFFLVAKALIEIAPKKVESEYRYEDQVYEQKDINGILRKYSQTVQQEVKNILSSGGMAQSALFTFADGTANNEDYSQYKVRGHYTKNDILATYFRVMMWFGRSNFIVSLSNATNNLTGTETENLSRNMLPIALLITDIANKNDEIYSAWGEIFDPITVLVGLSDDLSLYEVLPLWRDFSVGDLKIWSGSVENLRKFLLAANKQLKQPSISGTSLFQSASAGTNEDRKPPMGFRLFGQRYTVDAHIMTETTSPRVLYRTFASSLEVLAALGSESANAILSSEYSEYPTLEKAVKAFKNDIEKAGTGKAFGKTYYGSVLSEIATLSKFENGLGFYFTESPLWAKKQLNTQLGVLAELKHDTILYTKQSGAELGGGGWMTYRTFSLPRPINYVEPNLAFFENAIASTKILYDIYKAYGLANTDVLQTLENFVKLCTELRDIVKLEIEDKPISSEQNYLLFPNSLCTRLTNLIQFSSGDAYSTTTKNTAVVADVFTDFDNGLALEFGTGIPYKIYVPLNDGHGGKRIAIGYCFNSYEFATDMKNRLTDEEWRAEVYGRSVEELDRFKPDWLKVNYVK